MQPLRPLPAQAQESQLPGSGNIHISPGLPAQAQESQLPGSGNIHMSPGFNKSTSNLHQKTLIGNEIWCFFKLWCGCCSLNLF